MHNHDQLDSKTRLVESTIRLICIRGYEAASAESIAASAGVTKGSLYHHFSDKEDLTIAAVRHWRQQKSLLFASAPYRQIADPVARLLAYVDFQRELIRGDLPDFTCLLGTLAQTIYMTSPAIRDACGAAIEDHIALVRADVAEAFRRYGVGDEHGAARFSVFVQAAIQGAFVLAKAQFSPAVAIECLDQLKQTIAVLFDQARTCGNAAAA